MRKLFGPIAGLLAACTSPVPIEMELVNPCNQQAIDQVDFLRFEPRGTDVDSSGLTTVLSAADAAAPPIQIPLASDFSLVVTGHREAFDTPASAIGVSAEYDLVGQDEAISVRVPFSLIDSFYLTTDLADPINCSAMQVPRYGATVTYLPESGKALVVGGETLKSGTVEYRRSLEMFDPASGRFEIVGELQPGAARSFHTASLLADGRVLVAGGEAVTGVMKESLASALIIDPRDPDRVEVSEIIRMPRPRTGHEAVRLADGRVVLVGGRILNPAARTELDHNYLDQLDVFDPAKGQFADPNANEISGTLQLERPRFGHSATLLASGREILVAGGFDSGGAIQQFEVVKVTGDAVQVTTASTAGAGTAVGPIFHSAALADDGRVLLSGGYGTLDEAAPPGRMPFNASVNVEMWQWREARGQLIRLCNATLQEGRGLFTTSIVGDRALFVGGRRPDGRPTPSAEIVSLGRGPSCFESTSTRVEMADPRAQHTATELGTGEILIVGGRQQNAGDQFGESISSAELFSPQRRP